MKGGEELKILDRFFVICGLFGFIAGAVMLIVLTYNYDISPVLSGGQELSVWCSLAGLAACSLIGGILITGNTISNHGR